MNIIKATIIFLILTIYLFAMPPHKGDSEKTRMLMKWKLTEYLDISEEQGDKFFPRFNSFQKEHKLILKQIGELFDDVEEMIDDKKVDDGKVIKIQNQINDLLHERHTLKNNFLDKNKDILTDEQFAKLLIFEHIFKRKMKKEFNPHEKSGKRKKKFRESKRHRF